MQMLPNLHGQWIQLFWGLSRGPVFMRLVAKRILIEASPNLFYLDEVRAQIHATGRRTIALVLWAVILVVLVAYLYLTK